MNSSSDPYLNKWWALLGFGLSVTILNLDLTIVNLALPVIASIFRISLTNLQWINNSFMLTATCITLIAGHFADQYGRRKIYLMGMAVFAIGSLLASIAVNPWMIVAGRSLQGMGIGVAFPMTLILLSESFPEHQRGMAMGLLSTFTGVSQAIGPTIGGIIVQWLGWRWAFIINLPICPLVMLIIWKKCQAGIAGAGKTHPLPISSVIFLMVSLVAIITGLNQIHQWGIFSAAFWLTFGGGVLLLIYVLFQQTRLAHPWIDLSLFKNPMFAAINVIRPIFQFVFFGFYFILPLYLQNFLGYSPTQSGLIILLMSVAMGILSPLVGRYVDRVGVRQPLILAQCYMIIGFSVLIFTPAHFNIGILGIGLLAMGVCTGIMFPASNYTAISALPSEKKGLGLGIFTTTAGLASSLGIAISGAILSLSSTAHFNRLLTHTPMANLASQTDLNNIVTGAQPLHLLSQIYPQQSATLMPLVQNSFLLAFHCVMILYVILGLIALFFCRFLTNQRETSLSDIKRRGATFPSS